MADATTTLISDALRSQYEIMLGWIEGTLQDITADQAHWNLSRRVVPAGAP